MGHRPCRRPRHRGLTRQSASTATNGGIPASRPVAANAAPAAAAQQSVRSGSQPSMTTAGTSCGEDVTGTCGVDHLHGRRGDPPLPQPEGHDVAGPGGQHGETCHRGSGLFHGVFVGGPHHPLGQPGVLDRAVEPHHRDRSRPGVEGDDRGGFPGEPVEQHHLDLVPLVDLGPPCSFVTGADDGSVAARLHQNQAVPGRLTSRPLQQEQVEVVLLERLDQRITQGIDADNQAGQTGVDVPRGQRNRRVGGLAAPRDPPAGRPDVVTRSRQAVDPVHEVRVHGAIDENSHRGGRLTEDADRERRTPAAAATPGCTKDSVSCVQRRAVPRIHPQRQRRSAFGVLPSAPFRSPLRDVFPHPGTGVVPCPAWEFCA